MAKDTFVSRHNGPRNHQLKSMFDKVGVSSLDELIDQTVPTGSFSYVRREKSFLPQ